MNDFDNIVENGAFAQYEQMLHFQQCFQYSSAIESTWGIWTTGLNITVVTRTEMWSIQFNMANIWLCSWAKIPYNNYSGDSNVRTLITQIPDSSNCIYIAFSTHTMVVGPTFKSPNHLKVSFKLRLILAC